MTLRGMQIVMLSVLLVAASMDSSAVEPLKDAASSAAPTNIASDGIADQEVWREYFNTTYHFRFRYPLSAKLDNYESQVDVVFRPKFDNGQEVWLGLTVIVFPNAQGLIAKKLALDAIKNRILRTEGSVSVLEQGAVKIGGRGGLSN